MKPYKRHCLSRLRDEFANASWHQRSGAHSKLEELRGVVTRRRLSEKNFGAIQDFLAGHDKTYPVSFIRDSANTEQSRKSIPLSRLQIDEWRGTMVPEKQGDLFLYRPTMLHIHASQHTLFVFERALPVFFSTIHVEERFFERTGKTLNYKDEAFRRTAALSIMISKLAADRMHRSERDKISVVIPHPAGIFLGYAVPAGSTLSVQQKTQAHSLQLCESDAQHVPTADPRMKCIATRNALYETAKAMLPPTEEILSIPPFSTGASLYIRTFVDFEKLDMTARALHNYFMAEIMDTSNHSYGHTLDALLRAYTIGSADRAVLLDTLKNLDKKKGGMGLGAIKTWNFAGINQTMKKLEELSEKMMWQVVHNTGNDHLDRRAAEEAESPPAAQSAPRPAVA